MLAVLVPLAAITFIAAVKNTDLAWPALRHHRNVPDVLTVEEILKRDGYLDRPSVPLTEAERCKVDAMVGLPVRPSCKEDHR